MLGMLSILWMNVKSPKKKASAILMTDNLNIRNEKGENMKWKQQQQPKPNGKTFCCDVVFVILKIFRAMMLSICCMRCRETEMNLDNSPALYWTSSIQKPWFNNRKRSTCSRVPDSDTLLSSIVIKMSDKCLRFSKRFQTK